MRITMELIREKKTETRLKSMDYAGIVEWIHRLEDNVTKLRIEINKLEREVEELTDEMKVRGQIGS